MHLLFATAENAGEPQSWNGTPFNMLQALERNFERVTVLHSPRPRRSLWDAFLGLMLGPRRYPLWMTKTALRAYGRRLDRAIEDLQPDAVLCVSSQHLIYARAMQVPCFMISDAPWMAVREAYRAYEALPLPASRYAAQEAQAARKLSSVIYPTPWACREAVQRFQIAPDRCKRIPLGANHFSQRPDEQIDLAIQQRKLAPLQFLFIGKDWERKGGPLALQIVKALNHQGREAVLHIVGCTPTLAPEDRHSVRILGYLSPDDPEHVEQLEQAYAQADFFLLPSRAECFGLVFAEAQSYGLPCISLNHHGIPGVIDHNRTGLLFETDASAATIAQEITILVQDTLRYREMARAARRKFAEELNWDRFGRKIYVAIASQ